MLAAKNEQDGKLEEEEEQEDDPEDEITQPVQRSASTKSAFAMVSAARFSWLDPLIESSQKERLVDSSVDTCIF